MKTKIEDLTDEQLDYFCAIAQGWNQKYGYWFNEKNKRVSAFFGYHPTTNATQCYEIMEREKMEVKQKGGRWFAKIDNEAVFSSAFGATAKQAIIRCFVKSKLGEEVDCG